MKKLFKTEFSKDLLIEFKGAKVQIWIYHVSHQRLALRLSLENHHEVLYLLANGCQYMSGPFSWKNSEMILLDNYNIAGDEVGVLVIDKPKGFRLECSSVVFLKGPSRDFPESFEDFMEGL